MSLANLIIKGSLRRLATATTAIFATQHEESWGTVATVATVAVAGVQYRAANDQILDPDRWCWPDSTAMNGHEIDTFTSRLTRFTDKGMMLDGAETLADKLMLRDRDHDDRSVCLECKHCAGHGAGSWRCGNWQAAGIASTSRDAQLPADLVVQLQRCDGFTAHLTSTQQGTDDDHDHH